MIKNGGWHFSYLGGKEAIRAKTAAFCHPGLAAAKFMNDQHLDQVFATGADLFYRDHPRGSFIEVDDTWPRHLVANRERFSHLIKEM